MKTTRILTLTGYCFAFAYSAQAANTVEPITVGTTDLVQNSDGTHFNSSHDYFPKPNTRLLALGAVFLPRRCG